MRFNAVVALSSTRHTGSSLLLTFRYFIASPLQIEHLHSILKLLNLSYTVEQKAGRLSNENDHRISQHFMSLEDSPPVVPVSGSFSDYGSRLPNGTWTSYLGELQRDNVDVFVAPITDTQERRRHFTLLDTLL